MITLAGFFHKKDFDVIAAIVEVIIIANLHPK